MSQSLVFAPLSVSSSFPSRSSQLIRSLKVGASVATCLVLLTAGGPARAQATSEEAPATAAPTAATPTAEAPPTVSPELAALRARLDEIDQRSRIVERKQEIADEEQAKRAKEASVLGADGNGFQLKSADGNYALAFRGLLMADGRFLLDDKALELRDTFVVSRVRPSFDFLGKFAELHFLPDFGNGNVTILDAYGELRFFPWLRLRVGKSKSPVGIERLQGDAAVTFVERALPTQFTPNRDIGAALVGDILNGVISYTLGVTNGAWDGQNLDADTNFAKDYVGRLAVTPLKNDPHSFLARLSVGVGGTTGNHRATPSVLQTAKDGTVSVKTASAANLGSYKTTGQQTFFSYWLKDGTADSTTLGLGRQTRISPYLTYYVGGFGLIGELFYDRIHVVKGSSSETLTHRAYQVFASYVFGGTASYDGTKVVTPFDPSNGSWGAFEIAARFHELRLDSDTFPTFADPTASAKLARAAGGQLTWYWSRNVKIAAAYEQTWFEGGAAGNADRATEKLLQTRIQLVY